jgi:hypothetical protein
LVMALEKQQKRTKKGGAKLPLYWNLMMAPKN